MSVLDKLLENLIAQYPIASAWIAIFIFGLMFLATPYGIYVLFSERFNKGRWIFERKNIGPDAREHLYLLDTMKGRLYWVDGKAHYSLMHSRDWKEERQQAKKNSEG